MGSHSLLQRIFLTQGSNPHLLCLLHCRQILYLLSHRGSPGERTWPSGKQGFSHRVVVWRELLVPALCGRGSSPEDGDPRRPGEGMTSTHREPEAVGMRVPPGQAADKHPGFLSHIRPASLLPRGPPVSLFSFPLPFLLPAPLSPSSFLL